MPIALQIVEDQQILREGLKRLIDAETEFEVVGEATTGHEAVELAEELSPDVILMDISIPELNGVEATRRIQRNDPDIQILAFSVHQGAEHIRRMLDAGACGYIAKDCVFEELREALDTVAGGKYYFDPGTLQILIQDYVNNLDSLLQDDVTGRLTPREREILQLLAEGNTTGQIAEKLEISGKTVDAHRQNMMDKLDIHNVAGLTRFAVNQGLLDA